MHDNKIGIADTSSRREVATVPLTGSPVSLTLSADGRTAYASAESDDTVFVVSVPERKLIKSFRTAKGSGPDPVLELPVR
jgi:hypothetical protein